MDADQNGHEPGDSECHRNERRCRRGVRYAPGVTAVIVPVATPRPCPSPGPTDREQAASDEKDDEDEPRRVRPSDDATNRGDERQAVVDGDGYCRETDQGEACGLAGGTFHRSAKA